MPLTEEEKQRRREALARGREKAAANRAALKAAPKPEPAVMPPIVHDGDSSSPVIGDPPLPDAAEYEPLDDFERFLAAQDADTREALTDLELRVIYETAAAKANAAKKEAAKKLAAQRAERHARSTAGLIGPEALAAAKLREDMNRMCTWTVNLPEAGNSGTIIDEGIRIDGKLYVHGTQMTGTKAQYISYLEIEWRAHENERQFQGRSRMQRLAMSGMRFLNNEGRA